MILSDHEIQAALELGMVVVDPVPDARMFSSTALDLTLDGVVLRWNPPRPLPSGQPNKLRPAGEGFDVTAPTIHAGFGYNPNVPDNPGLPIQLEIFNVGNQTIVLDVGMPICQLILEEVREVPTKGYQGRFSAQQTFSV